MLLLILAFLLVCSFRIVPGAFGQTVTFGVVTGASLTGDFGNLSCTAPPGGVLTGPGCPRIIGADSLTVSNASKSLILGPRVNIHLSKSLSVEAEALHRQIRSHQEWKVTYSPPLVFPNGTTLTSFTSSRTGTEFSWEFPVLGKYQIFASKLNPFIEAGPSFRPAENRELIGVTVGVGVETHMRGLNVSPAVRYTRWKDTGRYLGALQNQFQIVLGVDRPSSESISVFGYKVSLGGVGGWGLTGGLKTESAPFNGTVRDSRTGIESPAQGTFFDNLNGFSPVAGMMLEFKWGQHMSVEMDGLYRPLNARDVVIRSDGSAASDGLRFTVLTWEFPIMAKYKPLVSRTSPFLELGPALRASGNTNGAAPSGIGVTGGAGIERRQGKFTVAPALRFTHWAEDWRRAGIRTRRNQLELVVGFSF